MIGVPMRNEQHVKGRAVQSRRYRIQVSHMPDPGIHEGRDPPSQQPRIVASRTGPGGGIAGGDQHEDIVRRCEVPRGAAAPYNRRMVLIFGKDTCPYTQAALEDYEGRQVPVQYINVKKNAADLQRMLTYSAGRREVPVIVEGERVTIGFDGGT